MINIDDFKSYNDAYGLYKGDLYLKWVADALDTRLKEHGQLVARMGIAKLPFHCLKPILRKLRKLPRTRGRLFYHCKFRIGIPRTDKF